MTENPSAPNNLLSDAIAFLGDARLTKPIKPSGKRRAQPRRNAPPRSAERLVEQLAAALAEVRSQLDGLDPDERSPGTDVAATLLRGTDELLTDIFEIVKSAAEVKA